MTNWILYILQCGDGSYYTGITNNLEKRLSEHTEGTVAKYTRGRGPFKIVYTEIHENRSSASIREFKIKKMSRTEKEEITKRDR